MIVKFRQIDGARVQNVVCFVLFCFFRLEIPLYCLGIIAVFNAIGFVIYRGSNSQKSEFRRNPLNPALARE
jgi:hypothetical protein